VTIYGLSYQQKKDPSLNEIYNLADAVIVSTGFFKNILIQSGVEPTRIHVIPYGVNLKPLNNTKREGFIMFTGSPLIDVKGFQYLAPALRLLKEKGKQISLKLHGFYMAGHKEWAISVAKDEGVDDMLTWLSIGSEEELHEHYQKSIGCVIPYIDYPGCFPAAVAMANGTPIITSDAMGLPEYVSGGSGIVTKSRSIEPLADALNELIDNEALRTRMGAQGRKTAEEKHSWDVVSKQTAEVYKKLLNI
jgi:glycosyltransferase involved in cell wall biosynthesis